MVNEQASERKQLRSMQNLKIKFNEIEATVRARSIKMGFAGSTNHREQ